MGSPGINNDRTPDCHLVSLTLMRPQVTDLTAERSFDLQATGSLMCVAYFVDMFFIGCFLQPGPASTRSTGAGIKCRHCPCLVVGRVTPFI